MWGAHSISHFSPHTTADSSPIHSNGRLVSVRVLPLLSQKDNKVHGEQISDTISDMT